MKKVISISLGSDRRDHKVEVELLGEKISIERRGTNGDKKKAAQLFTNLDGKYDAFGMGGIDLSIQVANNSYIFRDAKKLIKNVKKTPVVDGSGLKDTLERITVNYMDDELNINLKNKKVLLTAAMDRFGMAETFYQREADLVCGDLIFGLGIPIRIKSFNTLKFIAAAIAPIITKLPFELVYPTGDRQNQEKKDDDKFEKFYQKADIIAGDFHYIKSHIPQSLNNKIILTNTTTSSDIENLQKKGVKAILTTTPNLEGRTFGTNVMEAVLVALLNKDLPEISKEDYVNILDKLDFKPNYITFKNREDVDNG